MLEAPGPDLTRVMERAGWGLRSRSLSTCRLSATAQQSVSNHLTTDNRWPLPQREGQPPLFSYVCAFTRQVSKRRRAADTQIRPAFQLANPDAARHRYFANAVEHLRL